MVIKILLINSINLQKTQKETKKNYHTTLIQQYKTIFINLKSPFMKKNLMRLFVCVSVEINEKTNLFEQIF